MYDRCAGPYNCIEHSLLVCMCSSAARSVISGLNDKAEYVMVAHAQAKPAGQAAATRPAFRQQQRAVLFAAVLTAAATGVLAWQRQLPFQHETLPPVLRSLMRCCRDHSLRT